MKKLIHYSINKIVYKIFTKTAWYRRRNYIIYKYTIFIYS